MSKYNIIIYWIQYTYVYIVYTYSEKVFYICGISMVSSFALMGNT